MEKIPFNLEKALAGEAVVTRDGQRVVEIFKFKKPDRNKYQIVAMIEDDYIISTDYLGRYHTGEGESGNDLFIVPKTKTYYANVYQDLEGKFRLGGIQKTEHGNIFCIGGDRFVKTISFDIEEPKKPEKKTIWVGVMKCIKHCDTRGDFYHVSTGFESKDDLKNHLNCYSGNQEFEIKQIEVEV